jgi:hypothetical protein
MREPSIRCQGCDNYHSAASVQKTALAAIVARGHNSIGRSYVGPMTKPPRDRRTQPYRQPTYKRLSARVDRLEDAISHFYNVLTELRSVVSTLEKKSKPEDEQTNLNTSG